MTQPDDSLKEVPNTQAGLDELERRVTLEWVYLNCKASRAGGEHHDQVCFSIREDSVSWLIPPSSSPLEVLEDHAYVPSSGTLARLWYYDFPPLDPEDDHEQTVHVSLREYDGANHVVLGTQPVYIKLGSLGAEIRWIDADGVSILGTSRLLSFADNDGRYEVKVRVI